MEGYIIIYAVVYGDGTPEDLCQEKDQAQELADSHRDDNPDTNPVVEERRVKAGAPSLHEGDQVYLVCDNNKIVAVYMNADIAAAFASRSMLPPAAYERYMCVRDERGAKPYEAWKLTVDSAEFEKYRDRLRAYPLFGERAMNEFG